MTEQQTTAHCTAYVLLRNRWMKITFVDSWTSVAYGSQYMASLGGKVKLQVQVWALLCSHGLWQSSKIQLSEFYSLNSSGTSQTFMICSLSWFSGTFHDKNFRWKSYQSVSGIILETEGQKKFLQKLFKNLLFLKNRNKQKKGPNQTYKLLHSQGNY